MSELEYRSAELVGVSFPERQIELVVMPYETETVINEPLRSYMEIVSRGAFAGVEKRTSQIRVNVDHKREVPSTIGKAMALHPSRTEGLVADIHISPGSLGDHALELAADGAIGASAGFGLLRENGGSGPVKKGAEVWETRSRRRLNPLHLDHIALTPDPAYETANVLAVRATEPAAALVIVMPNRERLELQDLLAFEADLNRRYGVAQR